MVRVDDLTALTNRPIARQHDICYMHIAYERILWKNSSPPPSKYPAMGAKAARFGDGTEAGFARR